MNSYAFMYPLAFVLLPALRTTGVFLSIWIRPLANCIIKWEIGSKKDSALWPQRNADPAPIFMRAKLFEPARHPRVARQSWPEGVVYPDLSMRQEYT
jgi:hypothetical protein